MIILSQIDSKKCFLIILKKPTRQLPTKNIWRDILHAKYFAKYSKPGFYFANNLTKTEDFRKH